MKINNHNKGFIVQGVIAIVALVLIAGGAYYVGTRNSKDVSLEEKKAMIYAENSPVIYSISPISGPVNTIVTVKGKKITGYDTEPDIFLKNSKGEVTTITGGKWSFGGDNQTLEFKVPSNLPSGTYKIYEDRNIIDKLEETVKSNELDFTVISSVSTTDWKIYSDSKNAFEIKYPSTLTSSGRLNSSMGGFDYINFKDSTDVDYSVRLQVYPHQTTLENFVKYFDYVKGVRSQITIDGTTAQKVVADTGLTSISFVKNGVGYYINSQTNVDDGKTAESMVSTFKFTSTTTDANGNPLPTITSVTPTTASIGTYIEIKGTHFSGFEGDKYAWIENTKGEKGIIYNDTGSTDSLIKFKLANKYCTKDNSYSGLPCDSYINIVPGTYNIYVQPWGNISNKVQLIVN